MAGGGGSFSFSPSGSRYTPTGQAKFVLNVGLVPEANRSRCSLKCLCKAKAGYGMDELALTDGSTSGGGSRCEASSWGRYSELDGCEAVRYCCDPSSLSVAGDHPVLNHPNSSSGRIPTLDAFNATCNSNCSNPCISFDGQSLSAYMDASCTTANPNLLPNETVREPNGQRASDGCQVRTANPSQGRSHKLKPDDASSHNNNNFMLCKRSGDPKVGFLAGNDRDLEVEELAGLSESINDSLFQEGQQKARGEERMNTVVKGSKRKAAEVLKNPPGAEVQSEERNIRNQNDPRIVRVSRMTGGKDRHSKVRTSRGLRDRRVRLSVQTAIKFYDLQDRLGYEQPSMAVDWLIKNAKAAIDDLHPITDASNITQMTYSNCYPGAGSPKESATASVAQATSHEVGIKNERQILTRAVHEQLPIQNTKDSYVGRSGSSTSDGSPMGTEYSSKYSLSKSARLKFARERARKKARNPPASSQVPHTNMLQSSVTAHLMNVVSHGTVPQESCCGRNGILSGTSTLWDYSMQDISCKEHSRQFQHMASEGFSSTSIASLQQLSSADMQSLLSSSSHQCLDMPDFTTTFTDPKQRTAVGNAAHMYINSLIDHQSQAMQKHLGSTFVPTVSSDVHFTTSDHSSRGPLQSNNSSSITTSNTLLQKNAFADASAKVSMLPFLAYDPRTPESFQTYFLDGNFKI